MSGWICGWLTGWRDAVWGLTRDALVTLIALIVSAIWAIVTLASVITRDYTPLVTVTPVMLVVSTALFAVRGRNGNGAGKNHS